MVLPSCFSLLVKHFTWNNHSVFKYLSPYIFSTINFLKLHEMVIVTAVRNWSESSWVHTAWIAGGWQTWCMKSSRKSAVCVGSRREGKRRHLTALFSYLIGVHKEDQFLFGSAQWKYMVDTNYLRKKLGFIKKWASLWGWLRTEAVTQIGGRFSIPGNTWSFDLGKAMSSLI